MLFLLVHRDRNINRLMVKRKQLRFILLYSIHSFICSFDRLAVKRKQVNRKLLLLYVRRLQRLKSSSSRWVSVCFNRTQPLVQISLDIKLEISTLRAFSVVYKAFHGKAAENLFSGFIENLCSSLNKHYRLGLFPRKSFRLFRENLSTRMSFLSHFQFIECPTS